MRIGHRLAGRYLALAAAICLAATMTSPSQVEAASKRLKPVSHGGVVRVQVGGKTAAYHRASAQKPVVLSVTGPTPLKILSRHLYADTAKTGRVTYSLRVEVDGVVLKTATHKAGVSTHAKLAGGLKVGALEESIVQIPTGSHTVRIYPTGKSRRVALRLFLDSGKKSAGKWIPFAPDRFLEAVRLHEKDRETTYYRFDQTHPIELTVRGPLDLRVRSRLDFGTANGYTQRYIARCQLDGKPWKSFALAALASHTATYPEHAEITPGAERTFALAVPTGVHRVSIFLEGTTAAGASLRIQANDRQLKGGAKLPSATTSRG